MAGDIGKVERFLNRGIAAADDRNRLVPVKEAITRRAGRYTLAHESRLAWQPEILRARPSRDDNRIGGIITSTSGQSERPRRKIDFLDIVILDLRAEAFGMLPHPFHQFGPHNALVIARPVVDFGCGHQLPADFDAGDNHRRQVGARRVNGSGVASGARADDDDWGVAI